MSAHRLPPEQRIDGLASDVVDLDIWPRMARNSYRHFREGGLSVSVARLATIGLWVAP